MGVALPFNFLHFMIPDGVSTNKEICAVVVGLKNGQAAGATRMRAEHIKVWLGDIRHEEKAARASKNSGKTANMGELGSKWQIFVQMIQIIWDQREIPTQMSWMVVVLLPKGGGNFRGKGLLDPCWKVVEKIMVHRHRMGAIEFHPCLHRGLPKQGTGTATIEAKLAQQLAWVE
jgi:hypothetical protein